jgi:hypothetical protein
MEGFLKLQYPMGKKNDDKGAFVFFLSPSLIQHPTRVNVGIKIFNNCPKTTTNSSSFHHNPNRCLNFCSRKFESKVKGGGQ